MIIMDDIQKKIREELANVQNSKFAKRTDAQLALYDERANNPEYAEQVRQSMSKRGDEWKENHRKELQRRHKDPVYQENLKKGLEKARAKEGFKETHKAAVREAQAVPKELVVKIFTEFHNPAREVDDVTYKKVLSNTYGVTVGHLNKICMARSEYVKECIGLTDPEINEIKQKHMDSKPKYRIKTFGVDVMELYKDYSYRSKFSVQLVWEVRFGKYKGMKKKQLEQVLGKSLSNDDSMSFKKSYSWLTESDSKELFYGGYAGATKFVKVLPTREEKFGFIKTGKYQGCFISYE
jgi:HD-GYP domain-containing protein (c-di-GMP phosphodiesterase class II)